MSDILIWIEHHPAITALITAIVLGLSAFFGWLINLIMRMGLASRSGSPEKSKETLVLMATQFKELALHLGDFGDNTITVDRGLFRFKAMINNYKSILTHLVARTSVVDLTISKEFEELRGILNDILNKKLLIDGGRSWRELCALVEAAKIKSEEIAKNIKDVT